VTATAFSPTERQPELVGQAVVVIGGSSGVGLETARRARPEGANVVLTGRDPARLQRAGNEVNALSDDVEQRRNQLRAVLPILWVPEMPSYHATWEYSWRRPPSRSRL
jgi:NAD(P)-dependent dehydrogenase (short-subunit alcohol dehydrogenase family)